MLPIGSLMVEHRLIERMIKLLAAEKEKLGSTNDSDPDFILSVADFFQTYADRCHHGKEEDILFEELENKDLESEHRDIMEELKAEHVIAREKVQALRESRVKYLEGDPEAPKITYDIIGALIELYPGHIEKEDKHFFFRAMDYFSKKEQMDMLNRFWEFDEHLIHRLYRDVVERYEGDR